MIITNQILFIFSISILQLLVLSHSSTHCQQSCVNGTTGHSQYVPYPFGFSSGCHIRLNCSTTTGNILIGEFPVRTISSDGIIIHLEAKCDRPIHTLQSLFSKHYAPTSKNGILLQNCSSPGTPCLLPSTTLVQTHFESLQCNDNSTTNNNSTTAMTNNNSTISCYSENKTNGFLSYENVTKSKCQYLLSSISVRSSNDSEVSLEVQVVQLGWWLEGKDCQCSNGASCTQMASPTTGNPSYQCQCKKGLIGDGYRNGTGCRKVSSECNASKYMSGQCGGITRVGVLIGGIVAGVSLMVCFGLICCCIRRRSSLKSQKMAKRRLNEATGTCTIPIYPYRNIEKATNYFSESQRLGTGAYGTVYSGKIHSDEDWVAIKRIKHSDSIEQVMNEIKLLSSVSHPNLVRLLGCSIDKGEQILVYEFMPNGTLSQHLQRTRGNGLPWPIRLTIAIETARAITHLHSAINPPIYHRDIKSSNILLDNNFRSKVADFGLSRLGLTEVSHISTAPQGTPGYLDPQYHQDFHLSDKSDVYSFGVVLVEIITALKVVDFTRPQNEVNLANLAIDRIGKGCLDELIDPFLEPHRDAWTLSSVHKVAELAFRCLAFHRDMRPTMMEVSTELEQMRPSKSADSEENNFATSSEASVCSSSSNLSEKPLSFKIKKIGLGGKGLLVLQTSDKYENSNESLKDNSPVSVRDPWLSEQSSPSSNSLLNNVIQ